MQLIILGMLFEDILNNHENRLKKCGKSVLKAKKRPRRGTRTSRSKRLARANALSNSFSVVLILCARSMHLLPKYRQYAMVSMA